jgi:hypothetical protein
MSLSKNNFLETGLPFSGMSSNVKFTKTNRQYKDDYKQLVGLLNSPSILNTRNWANTRNEGDSNFKLSDTSDGLNIEMRVANGNIPTFKFLGMDITEDLDVVVKGKVSMTYLGNLCTSDVPWNTDTKIVKPTIENVDIMKEIIQSIKFDIMYALPSQDIDLGELIKGLSDVVDKVKKTDLSFKSVLLNYIHVNTTVSADASNLSDDEIGRILWGALCIIFDKFIGLYKLASKVLSILDTFFDMHSKIYGEMLTTTILKDSVSDKDSYGSIGAFYGYNQSSGGFMNSNVGADMAGIFVAEIADLSRNTNGVRRSSTSIDNKYLMASMFDLKGSEDLTKLSREDLLSYIVLDGMKYKDEDLIMIKDNYDLENEDDRDMFFKNTITSYRKLYKNYFKQGIFLEKNILDNIIPKDDTTVDVLKISDTSVPSSDLQLNNTIKQVAFDTSNLITSCKLIDKINKILLNSFKIIA